jgi:hypothetical protein
MAFRQRLGVGDVEVGSSEAVVRKRGDEGVRVYEPSARDVDEGAAGADRSELVGAEESSRLGCQRRRNDDVVALYQQLFEAVGPHRPVRPIHLPPRPRQGDRAYAEGDEASDRRARGAAGPEEPHGPPGEAASLDPLPR